MIHLWKNKTTDHNVMSITIQHSQYNSEFYKLAKMSLPEIKEYVSKNYPRAKANFFMKYKLQQYALFLSNSKIQV